MTQQQLDERLQRHGWPEWRIEARAGLPGCYGSRPQIASQVRKQEARLRLKNARARRKGVIRLTRRRGIAGMPAKWTEDARL